MRVEISKEWLMKMCYMERISEDDVYDAWFGEVLRAATLNGFSKSSLATFDKEAWRERFNDNKTPAEALMEELEAM